MKRTPIPEPFFTTPTLLLQPLRVGSCDDRRENDCSMPRLVVCLCVCVCEHPHKPHDKPGVAGKRNATERNAEEMETHGSCAVQTHARGAEYRSVGKKCKARLALGHKPPTHRNLPTGSKPRYRLPCVIKWRLSVSFRVCFALQLFPLRFPFPFLGPSSHGGSASLEISLPIGILLFLLPTPPPPSPFLFPSNIHTHTYCATSFCQHCERWLTNHRAFYNLQKLLGTAKTLRLV